MTSVLTNLFDGVAYGMLLFLLACGLAVDARTDEFRQSCPWRFRRWPAANILRDLGQSGALAVLCGATAGLCRQRADRPWRASARFTAISTPGAISTRCCSASASSSCRLLRSTTSWGRRAFFMKLPAALEGQFDVFGVGVGRYRLMLVVICGLLTAGLQLVLARTRFGSRLRAAVDDPRAASGLGINVPQVFAFTFAFGCGLAGLGGALSAEISRA